MAFDYIDGGAEREWTLRENSRAFEDVMFRPRSAVATRELRSQDHACSALPIDLPFILAPVGSSRMFYPRGEEARRARGRRRRHHLHAVDAVRLPDGGRQGRDDRHRRGISCIWSAAATSR